MPSEGEVQGLAALLEFQASRLASRTAPDGSPVLLADQSRTRWNRMLIRRGEEALRRAGDGPYAVQGAIAAHHAHAVRYEDTDWSAIAALYGQLLALTPSPVVALNWAVAVSMADGPKAALPLVDALSEDAALAGYHLLPSVRGELLERLGRGDEARREFEAAASMAGNSRDRALLLSKRRGARRARNDGFCRQL
jgi:predicted RNA polymerase sigma factor